VRREAGYTTVRPDGARRLYAVDPEPLREAHAWLDRYRTLWEGRLDRLGSYLDASAPPDTPRPEGTP
jgi:DNA-binding transcriptional ArsR family regulator